MKDLTAILNNPEQVLIFNGTVDRMVNDASFREFVRAGLDAGRKDPFAFHAYRTADREIKRRVAEAAQAKVVSDLRAALGQVDEMMFSPAEEPSKKKAKK